MLSLKQIEKAKLRMVREKLNQSKLARKIYCSATTLTMMFNQEKDFPKVEQRLLDWLSQSKKVEN